jgi:hypothetical protein
MTTSGSGLLLPTVIAAGVSAAALLTAVAVAGAVLMPSVPDRTSLPPVLPPAAVDHPPQPAPQPPP